MAWLGLAGGVMLIALILIDAFEAIILPRRVRHPYRLARLYYHLGWLGWQRAARLFAVGRWRQGFLSVFGPLSLFGLLGVWAAGLIYGFALVHWTLETPIANRTMTFDDYAYFSGTTFFTLGYGDLVPTESVGRLLSVTEAGLGFGFLAVVVTYLPVLYQAFSRREIMISLLDARAGSPPSAGELLRRLGGMQALEEMGPLLFEWERWSAELLESHLSYPLLRYYRSQHDNQSWLATLTTILDTTALLIAGIESAVVRQARLTFAMARHAAVDLAILSQAPPLPTTSDRLPKESFDHLRRTLRTAGVTLREGPEVEKILAELRGLYEPIVNALAAQFLFGMPSFLPEKPPVDNWQTSPWLPRSPSIGNLSPGMDAEDHFD